MEFKGTKGKWELSLNRKVILSKEDFNRKDCDLWEHQYDDLKEMEANAQLIASAPELLEACIDICNADNTFKLKEAREKAQKAIKKALGKEA